jgi:hypothetical protein
LPVKFRLPEQQPVVRFDVWSEGRALLDKSCEMGFRVMGCFLKLLVSAQAFDPSLTRFAPGSGRSSSTLKIQHLVHGYRVSSLKIVAFSLLVS